MATYSGSALKTFTSVHQTDPFWIGVDVHKRCDHIALLRADSQAMTLTSAPVILVPVFKLLPQIHYEKFAQIPKEKNTNFIFSF